MVAREAAAWCRLPRRRRGRVGTRCSRPGCDEAVQLPTAWRIILKILPEGARIYRRMPLDSQAASRTGRTEPYPYYGHVVHCRPGSTLGNLQRRKGPARRARPTGCSRMTGFVEVETLRERSARTQNQQHMASPISAKNKRYVVQTAASVVQRCILITTGPGDLVFDPTCGSGTSAHIAEHWGRRWIACETLRVAVAIAR